LWVDFEEFDTREAVSPHLPENYFEQIALDHLAAGSGSKHEIGAAASFLFEAPDLVRFAVKWLERMTPLQSNTDSP
jgi:aminoglycoside 3-N-acetyltransferase